MFTESVVLMNTTGQLATFRHEISPVLKNSQSKPPSPKFILRDFSTDKQKMSIAFREVFKEFKSDTHEYKFKSENNDLLKKDRTSGAFHMGEKLLLSNDNMRPKSRSKTSITGQDIQRVSPCGSDLRHQYSSSATSKLDRHITEDILIKTHSDVLSPISSNCCKDIKNDSNSNARDKLDLLTESLKKGKRLRKRNSLSVKSKKGKHGRIFTASTSLQDKQPSGLHSQQNPTSSHLSKPGRISSEPPNLLRKHEYVPSMSDIRSQRAVKSRLQAMEKEAHKKQEKRREAQAKVEKQQLKDREKQIKAKQRKEIYALNKIMTELENKRFLDFCQAKGLNKV